MAKVPNLVGMRFGWLTVLERTKVGNKSFWSCLCDCGAIVAHKTSTLRTGNTKSCGCRKSQRNKTGNLKHGGRRTLTGETEKTYYVWVEMRQRCSNPDNPSYKYYGAKGVTVCERWQTSYPNFRSDMGERPYGFTLERLDTCGNYEPRNCVWASWKTQANNKRKIVKDNRGED